MKKLIQQSTEKIRNYQIRQFVKIAKTALKNANNLRKNQKLIKIIFILFFIYSLLPCSLRL